MLITAHSNARCRSSARTALDLPCGDRQLVQGNAGDLAQQQIGRVGRTAVPITVEVPGHLIDDRSNRHDVEVSEQYVVGSAKILVTHIPAANDRCLGIDSERFVMHAPVGTREIGQITECTYCSKHKRIE
jgi:hypothetical protein